MESVRNVSDPAVSGREAAWKSHHWLATGFVVFHLVVIPLFALPVDGFPLGSMRELLSPYARCMGLNEVWDMFAPSPKSAELYLDAVVTTVSGKTQIYRFPRMEELSLWKRFRQERYRKFVESVLCPDCGGLWPDIAMETARRVADPADPPYKVALVQLLSAVDPKTGESADEAHARRMMVVEQNVDPDLFR